MPMRMSSSIDSTGFSARAVRAPLTIGEALRTYLAILFGVSVSLLAFYYLFPYSP